MPPSRHCNIIMYYLESSQLIIMSIVTLKSYPDSVVKNTCNYVNA